MATITQQTIEAIADQAGLDPEESVRLDYSGRGMYGDSCVGITGSIGDLVSFVATAVRLAEETGADEEIREFVRNIEDVSTDSMGYDSIFYWTRVTATNVTPRAEEDEEDEEDERPDVDDVPTIVNRMWQDA